MAKSKIMEQLLEMDRLLNMEDSPKVYRIHETLPWGFTGAAPSLDNTYAIGVLYSKKLSCGIAAVTIDGCPMDECIVKANDVGSFIVAAVNKTNEGGAA